MDKLTTTPRTRLRREPMRAVHDREALYQLIDEARICHIGFQDQDTSMVIPTLVWRIENNIYIHGSRGSRMLKQLAAGQEVCVTVTMMDGLVFARSAFLHSANYRSAVILGSFSKLEDPEEKTSVLKSFMEQLVTGRWDQLRPMTTQELAATDVLTMALEEVSVKVRSGGPNDPDADLAVPVWAGEVPIRQSHGTPVPAANLATGINPDWVDDRES